MPPLKEPPLPEGILARLNNLNDESSVEEWKAVGNDCFAQDCHLSAVRCYTRALELDPNSALIYSNRSAAYLKSTMFAGPSMALKDAERAVQLNPSWYKAHLRVADAQFARKKYEDAKRAYEKVLVLNGECAAARDSLKLVEQELFLQFLDEEKRKQRRDEINGDDEDSANKCDSISWSRNTTGSGNNVTVSSTSSNDGAQMDVSENEVERHIRLWSQDTFLREGRTAMRAFGATVEDADREAGVAYKRNLLSKFRHRLETDEPLRMSVERRLDRQMRIGENVDYRNPERHRATLMQGTDGVGLGISTDAYKSYKYESTMW